MIELISFSLGANTIPSNGEVTASLVLSEKAPVGTRILLASSDPALKIQRYVDVQPGEKTAQVVVKATVLQLGKTYTVVAQHQHVILRNVVKAVPSRVASIMFDPSSVVGGDSVNMTVRLDNVAEQGGAVITLEETNEAQGNQLFLPTLPISLIIDAGYNQSVLNLPVAKAYKDVAVTVTATYNGSSVSEVLLVRTTS